MAGHEHANLGRPPAGRVPGVAPILDPPGASLASYAIAAGNASMAAYALSRQVAPPAAGTLTDAQAAEAVAWTSARYDELSIGVIQHIAGVASTGTFDEASAQGVAAFQHANGLAVDGKVGHQTLTHEFPARVARQGHDQLIHLVADLCALDITTETSAVRFDETQAGRGASEFDPSGLRVIKLGANAFQTSRILRDTIRAQLLTRPPRAAAAGPVPAVLDPLDATIALAVDQVMLADAHSVRAVSVLVGGPRISAWNEDLVQRVAAFQIAGGLPGDGMVDLATLELLVTSLIGTADNNGAVRLIVDFFDFDDMDSLITIYFDPNQTANAETLFLDRSNPNQPSSIEVGPAGIGQPFAGLVHTIEHEYSHVRLLRQGEGDVPTHEFLSEIVELTSTLTPQEDVAGFMDDADRAVVNWNRMSSDRQIQHRDRFLEGRAEVRRRHAAAVPADQVTHQAVLDAWDAVVLPAGPPRL